MENEQAKDSVYIKVGQCISASENTWYYVVRFLGKGGNGTAYLALCTAGKYVGSVFALKVFHRISSEERKKRFLEEVKLMQSNHHPAMVQQYDEGEWNGYPFVVMDYMPHTLATQIRSSKISIGLGLSYTLHLLSALKHLHSLGIIHRDIKPENIFVRHNCAILGDFGLCKRNKNGEENEDDKEDVKGYIAMPFFYRSPELVQYAKNGTEIGPESDVFQLGLVLTYMFTGENPLEQPNDILDDLKLKRIKSISGNLGGRIYYVLSKMLNLDKSKRITVNYALDLFIKIYKDYMKEIQKVEKTLIDLEGSPVFFHP